MFNNGCGEVNIAPDEVAAMTFSDFMPAVGARYDEHHSAVITDAGTYTIDFCLRAKSLSDGSVQIALTNDGMIMQSSVVNADFNHDQPLNVTGFAMAEFAQGAHLHFIVYSKEGARFRLNDGVNLSMRATKIGPITTK